MLSNTLPSWSPDDLPELTEEEEQLVSNLFADCVTRLERSEVQSPDDYIKSKKQLLENPILQRHFLVLVNMDRLLRLGT